MELNKEQSDIVNEHNGIISVVAGPGSGKTRVLIERVENILLKNKGVKPSEILIISFTNKVKQEIKSRLFKQNPLLESVEVHTFHTFAIKYLKKYCDYINLPKNFMILDNDSSNIIMSEVYDIMKIDKSDIKYREMISLVSDFQEDIKTNDLSSNIPDFIKENLPNIVNLYNKIKIEKGYLDFNDLLLYLNKLLSKDIGKNIQNNIKFVMIDEAQDLNMTQFNFVKLMMNNGARNILLVGDLDQSIYEWRGAKPQLFYDFYNKSEKKFHLGMNYRSTMEIVSSSKLLIKNNKDRVDIDFNTKKIGTVPFFRHFLSQSQEVNFLCEKIKELLSNNVKPNEIAILYRSSYLTGIYERSLMSCGIKYYMYNGTEFYNRLEIKDSLSLLKVLYNNNDEISWMRILMNLNGVGKTTIKKIKAIKENTKANYFDVINTALILSKDKKAKNKIFSDKNIPHVENLLNTYGKVIDNYREMRFSSLLRHFVNNLDYKNIWSDENKDERMENYSELLKMMDEAYESGMNFEEYIDNVNLNTNIDELKNQEECIKLMTMHSSKGLEFDYVFLIGVVDGIIPSNKTISEHQDNGLEQERRLMYVAMTRARKELFLLSSKVLTWGNSSNFDFPSRFVKEAGLKA